MCCRGQFPLPKKEKKPRLNSNYIKVEIYKYVLIHAHDNTHPQTHVQCRLDYVEGLLCVGLRSKEKGLKTGSNNI